MLRPYHNIPGPRNVPVLRHGDVAGERRAAELAEVDIEDDMLGGAEALCYATRSIELGGVALAVAERQGVAVEALALRDREGGGGVEAAGEEDDCTGTVHGSGNLVEREGVVADHTYLWSTL